MKKEKALRLRVDRATEGELFPPWTLSAQRFKFNSPLQDRVPEVGPLTEEIILVTLVFERGLLTVPSLNGFRGFPYVCSLPQEFRYLHYSYKKILQQKTLNHFTISCSEVTFQPHCLLYQQAMSVSLV